MKKIVVALAAASVISLAGSAGAQEPVAQEPVQAVAQDAVQAVAQDVAQEAAPVEVNQAPVAAPAPVAQRAPVNRRTRSSRNVRTNRRGGLLSELIELERRKNAWLRRTFLGR